jgi:hypothetical protein
VYPHNIFKQLLVEKIMIRDIGVYDRNMPSGLSVPIVMAMEEKTAEFSHYDQLPETTDSDLPPVFIINPNAFECEPEYWARVVSCAEENPKTQFVVFVPFYHTYLGAKKELGERENIELLSRRDGDMSRLLEIVGLEN